MNSMASTLARWWALGRKDIDAPLITVLRLSGVLAAPSGGVPRPQARRLLNLERVEKWITRAFLKPLRPAACAVVVNSPGGSPVQSELIHDAIRRASKETGVPVYSFAEDVAASGGYWLLCAGDKSYACSTSIVGSVGVISATFGAVDAAKKIGIERRVFTSGDEKLPLDPFLPVTSEQENRLRYVMDDLHDTFKAVVRSRRGDRLRVPESELFTGRVYSGKQAAEVGLVDGLGSLRQVMKERFGNRARFLLCSEPQQPGLRDILGFGGSKLMARLGDGQHEDLVGSAIRAALDEAEYRALWNSFTLK